MEQHYFYQIIEQYGIYAVFALCTIEGDITLLISGVMAHSLFFGKYSFLKVLVAGMMGGVAGDSFGYWVGRLFAQTIRNYQFYQRAQPRIERLVNKFGGAAIIISKYIYGIRIAICISSGVGRMPFLRFLFNDFISCTVWALLLAGTGYFFSGAITSIIGDFQQIGIALFVIVVIGIVGFYLLETLWLSKKVEEADPETIHKIEETIHDLEDRLHIPHRHDEKIEREMQRREDSEIKED
jgi:membrane protein DedA with SNARE-associated domain